MTAPYSGQAERRIRLVHVVNLVAMMNETLLDIEAAPAQVFVSKKALALTLVSLPKEQTKHTE